MYHPAAALHQGNLRQVLLDDFAKLPAILERARRHRGAGTRDQSPALEPRVPVRQAPIASPPAPIDDAPWAEPTALDDADVEFDPGAPPDLPEAAQAAQSPAVAAPGAGIQAPSSEAEAGKKMNSEPTAEQEAAPAAKSQQQLSLFE
jgi:hypothetical protein